MTSNLKIVSIFVLLLQIFISGCANKISSVDMSVLNGRKEALASHINTITKKQYITYDPADKPDSVGGYSDSVYFSDLDMTNLLSDGVTLYAPDEGDPDQDNLKEAWEVDQERVEILDPTNIFDASKVLSDEIQTAKDLITDFNTNSTTNDIYNNPEAIETLHTLINQIKEHKDLLTARTKKYSDDYSANAQKMKVTDALKAYFLLQLAEVNNKLESDDSFTLQALKNSFENESFSVKLNDNNAFSRFRGLPSQESINQVIDKYGALAVEYFNKPLFDHEKATIKFYGYSQSEWDALKVQDAQAAKDLVDATVEMARAVQIPATYGDVALSAFTLFKSAKALSKINLKDVKEFATQAKALKNELVNISASLKKFFAKNPAKNCLFSTLSLNTQGFSVHGNLEPCEFFPKILVSTITKNYRGKVYRYGNFTPIIKSTFDKNYKVLEQIAKNISDTNDIRYKAFEMLKTFKNNGVYIKTWGSPKFRHTKDYVIEEVDVGSIIQSRATDLSGNAIPSIIKDGFIKGGTTTKPKLSTLDFDFADEFLANKLELQGIITFPANASAKTKATLVAKFRTNNGLTWHHADDLKTLQLVPRAIHQAVKHAGGESYIKDLRKVPSAKRQKTILQYLNLSVKD